MRHKMGGLEVVNATKTIDIHITKSDVKNGRLKKPGLCAAALACMRQFKTTEARIHLGRAYILHGKKWVRFTTSPALRSEIVAFDRGGRFNPGVYTLYGMVPSKQNRTDKSGMTTRKYKKRTTVYHTTANVRHRAIITTAQ